MSVKSIIKLGNALQLAVALRWSVCPLQQFSPECDICRSKIKLIKVKLFWDLVLSLLVHWPFYLPAKS
jgi:hypothetical protein